MIEKAVAGGLICGLGEKFVEGSVSVLQWHNFAHAK
jgi:hypothetical protein